MNHSPSAGGPPVGEQAGARSLERRLAAHPPLRRRVEALLDIVEHDIASGCTADEAETHVREQLRALGQESLQHWADGANAQAEAHLRTQQPQARTHRKKNSTGRAPTA